MFDRIQPAPPDPILGLTDAYRADPRPCKVNLGVGVFMDETGTTPVLDAVRKAEHLLAATEKTKTYLPISGDPATMRLVGELVFGTFRSIAAAQRRNRSYDLAAPLEARLSHCIA